MSQNKPKRMVLAGWGGEKEGKSTFALSFPRPIEYFDFDFSLEGLDYDDDGVIYHPIHWSPMNDPQEMEQVLDSFIRQYTQAFSGGRCATVVLDTATQLDYLVNAVKLTPYREEAAKKKGVDTELAKVSPMNYGNRNAQLNSIYATPLHTPNVNAVFLHKAKDIWVGLDKTGRRELSGWFGATGIVHATIHLFKDGEDFLGEIQSSRFKFHPALTRFGEPTYETLAGIFGIDRGEEG